MFGIIAKKLFGSVNERFIKSLEVEVTRINDLESSFAKLSDEQLRAKTEEFKQRLASGSTIDDILHEAFANVREASKRVLGMRHFDVQLIGGMTLHQGKIAEMKTGEGKTLVSTLPCYLNALTGKGVHVVTVNDYLAKRDSEWMGKLHNFLGLTVGCITGNSSEEDRKKAYNCDITYATNNELGFDYLRDNMRYSLDEMVQRGHNFAIVDEVDSILIDEARTPLIISGPTEDNSKLYEEISRVIPKLESKDFQLEEKDKTVFLTEAGMETMEKILKKSGLVAEKDSLYDAQYLQLVHHINQALKAHKVFKNEVDYIKKDGSIVIIDEFTGRMQEGRRFSDGLHQALEAKESVKVQNENQTLASVTFQNYFRLYEKLAGMTGTAETEAVEFGETYGLSVIEIPTNKPVARADEDDAIYKNENGKLNAIVESIKEAYEKKQPVLVGTVSIEKSELLSRTLKKNNLPHSVLNAKYHAQEAEIIAQAGVPGAITIATNMAGRGTDIKLGGNEEMMIEKMKQENSGSAKIEEKAAKIMAQVEADRKTVIEAGGLYVLGTERHESRRIDNQLRGRSGRQGDPGKSKFFLSLEDDLMRIFGSEKLQSLLSGLGLKEDEAIFHPWITKTLAGAQAKVERRNYEIRKNLLKYDDVINNQRKTIFKIRQEVLSGDNVLQKLEEYSTQINRDIVTECIPKKAYREQWEIDVLEQEILRIYGIRIDLKNFVEQDGITEQEVLNLIDEKTKKVFADKNSLYGHEIFKNVGKQIWLITLDSEWKDHLLSLDKLRHSINFRAYAQKDPLIEYKREAFELFEEMMMRIEESLVNRLAHVHIGERSEGEEVDLLSKRAKQKTFESRNDPAAAAYEHRDKRHIQEVTETIRNNVSADDRDPNDPTSWGNVGRNEMCPCGSGKKFKHCHG